MLFLNLRTIKDLNSFTVVLNISVFNFGLILPFCPLTWFYATTLL